MLDDALEIRRLNALDGYRIIDTEPEATFDDLTELARMVCRAPVALISLVTADRQWFKSASGFDQRETPRDISVCTHAVAQDQPLYVIADMAADPRFADGPLVNGPERFRFYAGAVLRTEDGDALGTLCVLDREPRPNGLSEAEGQALRTLARQVMSLLELRQMLTRRAEREAQFRALADSMPQMVWSSRPDGHHDYYNARWYEFTGAPAGSTDGEGWNRMFHPDDQERAWERWRHSLATGEPYEIEYRLRRHDGAYRWTLGRARAVRDLDGTITRWFGTCTDIHDQKQLAEQESLLSRELSHRIKNIFSVVSGLVALSARRFPDAAGFAGDLRERIVALGRAHDFVRPQAVAGQARRLTRLSQLLAELLKPYRTEDADRVRIEGDEADIDDQAATPLALVFHELATNAAKYGALSRPEGRVTITSRAGEDALHVEWAETGGPPVKGPPAEEGFGSTLAQLSTETQLGGRLTKDWRPEGLVVTLVLPLGSLRRD
ncbi:MAG TPA: PAS domain-containing protein [Caulobacter sp.]|nr:PAS domain-containing protein [Caulobacter sp.]